MCHNVNDLFTPWLREQLVEHLHHLADQNWLDAALENESQAIDQILDFFDDTGVVDDPQRSINYILFDDNEADLLGRLGSALDKALEASAGKGLIDVPAWRSISSISREILKKFEGYSGDPK